MTVATGGNKLPSQLVGLGKAKEFAFTGEPVGTGEAFRIGLMNKVVRGQRLRAEALAMTRKGAELSPLALKLSRIDIEQRLG